MMRNCNLSKEYSRVLFWKISMIMRNSQEHFILAFKIYILKKIFKEKGITLFSGNLIDLRRKYYKGGFKVIQEFITNPI